jgi:hypothetical protein
VSFRQRWLAATVVVAAVLGLGSAVANAAIPNSSTGLINACYRTSNGALRVIDTQIGQTCSSAEQPINWPSSGSRATSWHAQAPVALPRTASTGAILVPGPVLPAGTWTVTLRVILVNGTGARDTFRCGLNNGAGGLLTGDATTVEGSAYHSVTIPGLITFSEPDRMNAQCFHDGNLPTSGALQAIHAEVIVEQVGSRF